MFFVCCCLLFLCFHRRSYQRHCIFRFYLNARTNSDVVENLMEAQNNVCISRPVQCVERLLYWILLPCVFFFATPTSHPLPKIEADGSIFSRLFVPAEWRQNVSDIMYFLFFRNFDIINHVTIAKLIVVSTYLLIKKIFCYGSYLL